MTQIVWDDQARDALRKLPRDDAERIARKLSQTVMNVARYLESVVGQEFNKIRIGDYRRATRPVSAGAAPLSTLEPAAISSVDSPPIHHCKARAPPSELG